MTGKVVGIIGLGNMGNGMAQSLLRARFKVIGTDLGEAQQIEAGTNAKVAGGAVMVKDVARNSTVVGTVAQVKSNQM